MGLVGVIFMIIDNEINFTSVYSKKADVSWILKITITMTTVILVGLVFYFHRVSLSLYAVNNSLDSWRIGLTSEKIFLILLEALICAIHPIPRYFPFIEYRKLDNSTISHPISLSYIEMDVALGLPSKYNSSYYKKIKKLKLIYSVCSYLFIMPFYSVSFSFIT
jgi:hypothetical protein